MFTGIIQEIGKIAHIRNLGGGIRLTVEGKRSVQDLSIRDSVSINGVCQTVVEISGPTFSVEAVEETLKKTTLGFLRTASPVNLELPLRVSDRVGGHIVQGHVDGVGAITKIESRVNSWLVTVEFPKEFLRYVISAGSIAVDGVSLTVASLNGNEAAVSIIPHTWQNTIFASYSVGSKVNIEFDIVGKYIERMLTVGPGGEEKAGLTAEKLHLWGY